MSFDLVLRPAEGFREWNDKQWEEFWSREPEGETAFWKRNYVWLALGCVTHNLEGGRAGSRFPLLMRVERGEHPGWYHAQLQGLLADLDEAVRGLSSVPITRQSMQYDNDEDVRRWVEAIQRQHPERAIASLYDLFFRFFDEFRELVRVAMAENRGIVVSY